MGALGELLFASSQGDLTNLKVQEQAGIDLYAKDYDDRTALHLAASEGHPECVQFLINACPKDKRDKCINAKDRWGGTPLGDAIEGGNQSCIKLLKDAGGTSTTNVVHDTHDPQDISDSATEIIFQAAEGDLYSLISSKAQGNDLYGCDYDQRTALHLAASEGHKECGDISLSKHLNPILKKYFPSKIAGVILLTKTQ